MLNNAADSRLLIAASTSSGVLALIATWLVLVEMTQHHALDMLGWLGPLSYGFALGSTVSGVYIAGGGRSLESAVSASILAALLISGAFAALAAIGAWGAVPFYALPLLAAFVFAWLLIIVVIMVVIPATIASLAVFGAVHVLRTVRRDGNHPEEGTTCAERSLRGDDRRR